MNTTRLVMNTTRLVMNCTTLEVLVFCLNNYENLKVLKHLFYAIVFTRSAR
jgi:hypothetical protein